MMNVTKYHKILATMAFLLVSACADSARTDPPTSGSFEQQVNQLRTARGLAPLRKDPGLQRAARAHARDMVQRGYFAHASPEGGKAGKRIENAGYSACGWGENLASGIRGERAAFDSWRASSGHRRNMLKSGFTEYGLAGVDGTWVMVLARPC